MTMRKKDMYQPPESALWLLPLGGSGEIGMNMNLYGTAGKWLMLDCGVMFADETTQTCPRRPMRPLSSSVAKICWASSSPTRTKTILARLNVCGRACAAPFTRRRLPVLLIAQ